MHKVRLGVVESQFADLVWANAPMTTRELVELCKKEMNWARTTTYPVLKKLCDRGILSMENSRVTVVLSRDEFYAIQSEQFVDDKFQGSLPAFLAAFAARKTPSAEEIAEIRKMIDTFERKGE